MNSLDRRVARLVGHRDRCLRFLAHHHPTLEAAKDTKWYRQYRTAQARIDCLRRRAQPSSENAVSLPRFALLKLS